MNRFYIASDNELMIDLLKGEINFLKSAWQNLLGRPLLTLTLKNVHLENNKVPLAMVQTMKKLKSGYINGTRVILGNLGDFINTSAITDLSFLGSQEDGYPDKLNPAVQSYLDEHLLRSFSHRASTTSIRSSGLRPRNLRRRMSVKGAIKKTRSINVDSETLGMEGNVTERRLSHSVTPQWLEPNQSGAVQPPRDTSPNQLGRFSEQRVSMDDTTKLHIQTSATNATPKIQLQPLPRHRPATETNFENTEVEELIAMLRETESLEEQGDILQHLVDTQGLDFNTGEYGAVED